MSNPTITPLPEGVVITNGGQRCDANTGPCACGAWHLEPQVIAWSPRQEMIIALITQGFTTGEIAQQMHLSPKRVEKHRNTINAKLGIFGRDKLLQLQRDAHRARQSIKHGGVR